MSKLLKSKILLGVMVVTVLAFGFVMFANLASADCSISMTLKQGMRNSEVSCLQEKLAVTPQTGYFGTITKAAVMAYQANHSLTADGIVGPLTRATLGTQVIVTPPTDLCPNGMTLASNCTVAPGTTTPPTETLCPNGNTLASNCATAPGTVVSPVGLEGSVTVTYDAVPANNLAVNRGEEKAVMAIKVKATGSDMNVSRVWLDINTRIWLSADQVTLLDGSTVLATLPLNSSTVTETTVGSAWQLQFNGLSVTVPKDTTKVLTFKVRRPTLTNANASVTIAATSTLRATDTAGISNTYTLSGRTWNMANVAASAGTLSASLSASAPLAQSVSGLSTTSGDLTPVKLMDFDLKATDGPINISLISGTLTAAGTCTAAQCAASTELRDGTEVLASVTGAATFSFSGLNIDIATGATKKLSIWVQANHIATSYVVKGDSLYALVNVVTATTGPDFTSASITPSVTGNAQYFFQYAPTLTLGATSVTQVEGSAVGKKAVNASLSFTVTAPSDSDIYVNATDGLVCGGTYPITKIGNAACSSTTIGGTMSAATVVVSGASSKGTGTLTTWDKVSMGQSRTFTIEGYIPDGNAAGMTGMTMATNGLQWTSTDNATIVGTDTTEQTWGLTDFKTGTKYVTA